MIAAIGGQAFPFAIDAGDLDGDGDLDLIVSNFNGDWHIYLNDGSAGFAAPSIIPPSSSASCAIMLDFDNDGDLDLVLIDEITDELIFLEN